MLLSFLGMVQVIITQALLLKNEKTKYDISPGVYFFEEKTFGNTKWMMLGKMPLGIPLKDWDKLLNKIIYIIKR